MNPTTPVQKEAMVTPNSSLVGQHLWTYIETRNMHNIVISELAQYSHYILMPIIKQE